LHFVEIAPMAGSEIVEADHILPEEQQRFEEMGPDETGATRDQPPQRPFA
jgi:hypothetical protein